MIASHRKKKKAIFKCLDGIFLRYMIAPKVSLKMGLIAIIIFDLVIGVTDLVNYISTEVKDVGP